MPTPVLYCDPRFNPCEFVAPARRTMEVPVFYATNRRGSGPADDRHYGNGMDDQLHLGETTVAFRPDSLTWDQLAAASGQAQRSVNVTTTVLAAREIAVVPDAAAPPGASAAGPLPADVQAFVDAIDACMQASGVYQVTMYIHGSKVNFEHVCLWSGELYHFLARSGAVVAFAWPTGQSLLTYGSDVARGRESGAALARLLDILSHTKAERVDIVAYSAGARVLAGGLVALREANGSLDEAALQQRFRIDDVIFAASDISVKRFATELLPKLYDLPRSIQVTISSHDDVLALANAFHGSSRLGRPNVNELDEATRADIRGREKVIVVDTTFHESERAFAIPGHGYWFRHPWAATDTLITLRFSATPAERGLEAVGPETPRAWYIPPDYPDRIVGALLAGMGLPADATAEQVEAWIVANARD